MRQFRIRQATLSDCEAIIAMDQLIFGAYGADEEPAVIRARLALFSEGCAILENEDNRGTGNQKRNLLLGYLTTEKWAENRVPALDEDPHETHDPNGHILNITTLAISPDHQNQGYGKRLLNHAIAIAHDHKCERITLETAHAQRFYQRHGFTVVNEREQRGIPLTVMQLILH